MARTLPRQLSASGLQPALDLLTAPYAAGLRLEAVPYGAGAFAAAGPLRAPLLLVRLRVNLADRAVVVIPSVNGTAHPPVVFAPYSGAGTLLPAFRPQPPTGGDVTGPLTVTATVHVVEGEAAFAPVPAVSGSLLDDDAAAKLLEGALLQGRLARLVLLATLEKQRMLREARLVAASRSLALMRAAALDASGRDLAVPRLAGEADGPYRARLAIFSSWRTATPAGFTAAVNGPGKASDANAGLPASFGIQPRFRIVEDQNDLAVSLRLLEVGPPGQTLVLRSHFQALLRATYLVDLDEPSPGPVPADRAHTLKSAAVFLGGELTRAAGPEPPRFVAPTVALALERAVRLLRRLDDTGPVELIRAHVADPDPLHELGLGVTLRRLEPGRLAAAAAAVAGITGDDQVSRLAAGLAPRPPADDPLGRWLFQAAGFRTVHPLDASMVYLSPYPSFGQFIEGPAELTLPSAGTPYFARYRPSGDAGSHVLAAAAVAETADRLTAAGLTPVPLALSGEDLVTALNATVAGVANPPPAELGPLISAGLVTADTGIAQGLLDSANLDLVVAYPLTIADLAALGSGAALRQALSERIGVLLASGFHSVRGVWDGSGARLLLLAGVTVLPGGLNRPGEAPGAAFRWYATAVPAPLPDGVPFATPVMVGQPVGGRTLVQPVRPGLALLVCVGYARRGLADPYEVRIELPEDAVLDLDQYGYAMNLLEALCPIGIEINTFELRQQHVSVAGGTPTFLSSTVSRTYHRYRRRRAAGGGQGRDRRDRGAG